MRKILAFIFLSTVITACTLPGEPTVQRLDFPTSVGQDYIIEGPDGGDCEAPILLSGGTWDKETKTCTWSSGAIYDGQTLIIRGGAKLVVIAQLVNFGTIWVRAGFPLGSTAEMVLGAESSPGSGAFINYGNLYIVPDQSSSSSGLSNYFQTQNFGSIVVSHVDVNGKRLGGIFNNFHEIINDGNILTSGFFHNSGPRVQSEQAVIETSSGIFNNAGILENLGLINGAVTGTGTCTGNCQ